MSTAAMPHVPTPDHLAAFVPYACRRLSAPFTVYFKTQVQEEYISKVDPKAAAKKSRGALAQAMASRPYVPGSQTKEESALMSVSVSCERDNSSVFILHAVTDATNHLIELLISPCHEVPRLLIKILSLCIPFNPYLNKLTMRCGLSGAALYETVKILSTSHITEIFLDDSRISERNYYLLLEYETRLQLLSLSRCDITDDDCALLIPKLAYPNPASKTLNSLILSSNLITNKGACLIAQVLRSNRALMYLNLSGNRISNQGAMEICTSLMEFPLTTEEIFLKRKRTLYYLRLRREVYEKCIKELKVSPVADTTDDRSGKRKNASTTTGILRRRQSVNLPAGTDIVVTADLRAIKAEKMASELVSAYPEPFRVEATVCRDNTIYSKGNLSLCYLNIAYNNLCYQSVVKLAEVVRYQSLVAKYPDLGLAGVQLDGNPVPRCKELDKLSEMLARALQVRLMYAAPQTGRRIDKSKKKI